LGVALAIIVGSALYQHVEVRAQKLERISGSPRQELTAGVRDRACLFNPTLHVAVKGSALRPDGRVDRPASAKLQRLADAA
jgi:hypothetical protein